MDIIKTGSTWVLRTAPVLDITGVRLTGLTDIKFSVSRYTGGAWQWLDTADMTFRASPAGYQFTMTAVDATKVAGVYHYVIDWTTVTNVTFGDQLFFDVQQVTLTNASNPNQSSETTYGSIIDKVEANLTVATSTLATSAALATAQGNITSILAFGAPPSAATVAAACVDQALAGHTTSGTVGAALSRVDVATSTLATSAALATAQGNITTILGYGAPPSASTISTQVNADITTAHGGGSYQTASVAGLATSTNVSDATTAINAHTDSATSPLAQQATLTAGIVSILSDVDGVPAATSAAVTSAHGAGSYVALTPPTAAAISAQVASDLATAHGAGSWATASLTGIATATDVTNAVAAIETYGQLHWVTATGFAQAGDAMTLTAPALTAVQSKILDDATPFHGASIATILAFGAPPNAAANAAAVWATVEGGSVGDMRYALTLLRERQTGRRKMGLDGYELIYGSDNVTVIARVLVKDIDGNIVVPAAGDPSEVSQEVAP